MDGASAPSCNITGTKTWLPTINPRKLLDAEGKGARKGQVARSRDLVTALTLLTATFVLAWQPEIWMERWRGLFTRLLETGTTSDIGLGTPIFSWTALTVAMWIAPC